MEPGTKSKTTMKPRTGSVHHGSKNQSIVKEGSGPLEREGHLELSLWWSSDDDHPLFGIHAFSWSNLNKYTQPQHAALSKVST